MKDRSYAESLKAGLEDAVAFIHGDTSRGRVVIREVKTPTHGAADAIRTRKALDGDHSLVLKPHGS